MGQKTQKDERKLIRGIGDFEALKPEAKSYMVRDERTMGLWCLVLPSGFKSWMLFYRLKGQGQRKVTFGPLTLAEARNEAARARILIEEKMDPAAVKRSLKTAQGRQTRQTELPPAIIEGTAILAPAPAPDTIRDQIEDVVERFVNEHAKLHTRDWKETQRLLQANFVAHLHGRRLSQLSHDDFYRILDGMVARGAAISANRTHAQISVMCKWASSRKVRLIDNNIFLGVEKPSKESKPRERVLNDDELRLIWNASTTLGFPYNQLVKMLMLTGARRSEVGDMCWSEVDIDKALWIIPSERSKNHREHTLPLSAQALSILRSLPHFDHSGDTDFVLSAGNTPPSGFSKAKKQLDGAVMHLNGGKAIDAWTLHDLRRSAASGLARLGVELHVIERMLNHVSGSFGGIVSVYQKHKFENEMRTALDKWGAHIESLNTKTTAKKRKFIDA